VLVSYAPRRDGRADAGEIVWTLVTFEDDRTQSKDRPVLIIGSRGAWLAGLQLTSKHHETGLFMDIGSGPWDRQRRPSQVRLDRLINVDPSRVRREGAALSPALFAKVVDAARPYLTELH